MSDQTPPSDEAGAGAPAPSLVTERNVKTEAPKRPGLFARARGGPLLPDAGAGGAPLTAVIGVMSFLAALALSALLIISSAASDWTSALRSEMTVQVKGADRTEIDAGVDAALAVLQETEGVLSATPRSREETAALLDPWLGQGNAEAFIAIPALIEVRADKDATIDLTTLRTRLTQAAPSATINDHSSWHTRLTAAARSGKALALAVFLLVMGAAAAISIFAARAGLAANHEIISVLHLVGATDGFIANEVQRRFFVLGLRGSLVGLFVALSALFLAGAVLSTNPGVGRFLPAFTLNGWLLFWLLLVPLITCLITAVTARVTVLKTLASQY